MKHKINKIADLSSTLQLSHLRTTDSETSSNPVYWETSSNFLRSPVTRLRVEERLSQEWLQKAVFNK